MNPTYEHRRPYDGCDLYRGDALEVLPLLAGQGIVADMVLSDPPYGTTHCRWDAVIDIRGDVECHTRRFRPRNSHTAVLPASFYQHIGLFQS